MTKALYDLIGADRQADRDDLRAAYSRAIAQIVRRRKALVEQGGDTGALDLARARADEAWAVLSDPVRRRRYDALLALTEEGPVPRGEELWSQVVGSLASPSAAAGVDLVRAMTHLGVGQLPGPASRVPDTPTQADADRTVPRDTQADIPTQADTRVPRESPSLRVAPPKLGGDPSRPTPEPVATEAPRVVPFQVTPSARVTGAGATEARRTPPPPADVVRLSPSTTPAPSTPRAGSTPAPPGTPTPAPTGSRRGAGSGLDVDALVAEHGWSGALLKSVREHKGMSVRDIGAATRISARYLDAIEADDHDHLPSATFVKGYLREIARTLGLDEAALVQGYMRRMG